MKKFILVALVIGVIVAAAKKQSRDRAEWHGMSEEQVRDKLGDRLPNKMPDEAKAAVTDKIVDKMREKGAIVDLTDTTADGQVADEAAVESESESDEVAADA